MLTPRWIRRSRALMVALVLAVPSRAQEAVTERVSEFSRYAGYSEPRYDGWRRESFYLTMRDGVRLACDLYRPTRSGQFHQEPLPLIWTHEAPYQSIYHKDLQDVFTSVWGSMSPSDKVYWKDGKTPK